MIDDIYNFFENILPNKFCCGQNANPIEILQQFLEFANSINSAQLHTFAQVTNFEVANILQQNAEIETSFHKLIQKMKDLQICIRNACEHFSKDLTSISIFLNEQECCMFVVNNKSVIESRNITLFVPNLSIPKPDECAFWQHVDKIYSLIFPSNQLVPISHSAANFAQQPSSQPQQQEKSSQQFLKSMFNKIENLTSNSAAGGKQPDISEVFSQLLNQDTIGSLTSIIQSGDKNEMMDMFKNLLDFMPNNNSQ